MMAGNVPQIPNEPGQQQGTAGRRLDSWKAIAAYLKRDVRTVKRWEKSEVLPVHRHLHRRQASVYAFEDELEAWRVNRSPVSQLEEPRERHRTGKRTARWAWLASMAAIVTVAVGIGFWLTRAPALSFSERDWVLISHFENRTGEPVFDGAVEYALERALANSHFINVVPHMRIADALRLMRKPADTRVDAAVGREVCLRDGGIHALITGRVERFDTTYVLSAELVNPQTGVTVASFSQEAIGKKQVVAAVGQLADGVRRTLGEGLAGIQSGRKALAKVTTPSLEALHLFTQADAVIARSDEGNASAEQLLRQAIADDPEFASAYVYLAFALLNQHRPPEEYRPYAQRALELSDKSSDSERYFILGAYHFMMGDLEKSVASYRTLVQLYPDHYWGNNNLGILLSIEGRLKEAVPFRVKMAQLQPHDFHTNFGAAWALINFDGDTRAARPYLERARQLISPEIRERAAGWAAWVELVPFSESWRQEHVREALAGLNRVAGQHQSSSQAARAEYTWQIAGGYLTLGKLQAAEELFRSLPDPEDRTQGLAMLAWARDDRKAIGKELQNPAGSLFNAMLLAYAGFPEQAEQAIATAQPPGPGHIWEAPGPDQEALRQAAHGQLALARGQTAQAIPLLEHAFVGLQKGEITSHFFLAADALARAREEGGDLKGAIKVLEETAKQKERIADTFPGAFWLRTEWHRAQLLRQLGRNEEARGIEAKLHKLLALSDPGYPFARKLDMQAPR